MSTPLTKKHLGKLKGTYYNYIGVTMRMTNPVKCVIAQNDNTRTIRLCANYYDLARATVALAWLTNSSKPVFGFLPPDEIRSGHKMYNGMSVYIIMATWRI